MFFIIGWRILKYKITLGNTDIKFSYSCRFSGIGKNCSVDLSWLNYKNILYITINDNYKTTNKRGISIPITKGMHRIDIGVYGGNDAKSFIIPLYNMPGMLNIELKPFPLQGISTDHYNIGVADLATRIPKYFTVKKLRAHVPIKICKLKDNQIILHPFNLNEYK